MIICILASLWGFGEGRVESCVAKAEEITASLLREVGYRCKIHSEHQILPVRCALVVLLVSISLFRSAKLPVSSQRRP